MTSSDNLPLRSFINLEHQNSIFNKKPFRIAILIIGCLLIPIWQYYFYKSASKLDTNYQIKRTSGMVGPERKFVYFYYYLSLFPVATDNVRMEHNSEEGARKVIADHGDSLVMELYHVIRVGDFGKTALYLFDAYRKGIAVGLSVIPLHALVFTLSLVALFVAFWWIRQPLLGILATLFIGSNPVQLYEVYAHENVFGWPIMTALIIMALHMPLLTDRKPSKYYVWTVPILSGIVLSTIRQIRSEPVTIIVAAGISYLFISKTSWRDKGMLVLLLVLSFSATSYGWKAYFDNKFEEAIQVVKQAGGHPYNHLRDHNHLVWHPIWCGLGDFDKKYGYVWQDRLAMKYALPILREKYNLDIPAWDSKQWGRKHRRYYEYEGQKYYRYVFIWPEYMEVLRAKVLHDITHDPLWYLDIILKRFGVVFSENVPVRLALGKWWLTIPMSGYLIFPMLIILIVFRNWLLLKIICFTLPLAATAILIFSGGNKAYYSCFHLFIVAICGAWLVEGAFWWYRSRKKVSKTA